MTFSRFVTLGGLSVYFKNKKNKKNINALSKIAVEKTTFLQHFCVIDIYNYRLFLLLKIPNDRQFMNNCIKAF